MKKIVILYLLISMLYILTGCTTAQYKKASKYNSQIKTMALLPVLVGDKNGKMHKLGKKEITAFLEYFEDHFYMQFEQDVKLVNGIKLKLPGRDFNIDMYNSIDYTQAVKKLKVDAVLGINIVLYNEVTPEAMGAQIAGAIVTEILFGRHIRENRIVRYHSNYAYPADVVVFDSIEFEFKLLKKVLPTIEGQREYFVDSLVEYLDRNLPVSTDYKNRK